MLRTLTTEGLTGVWRMSQRCRALRISFDQEAASLRAHLLYWKRGKLGCDSRSSDIAEVELQDVASADADLVLTGLLPANAPGGIRGRFTISMTLREPGSAVGVVEDVDGSTYPVTLDLVDSLPSFELTGS
jgi:hypothetical protein